jgi:peptidoglycan-N-acetylglucosamine deacetylase
MQNLKIVTTSWDDGDPSDLMVAEVLRSRGLTGTFYVPIIGYDGRLTLDPGHLRSLRSGDFEVGGHGTSHNILTHLDPKEIAREVRICKSRLEDILGDPVRMFCYPKGRYSARVVRHVREAGYQGARTSHMLATKLNFDPFEMPVSLQAYPHKQSDYLKNNLHAQSIRGLFDYTVHLSRIASWPELGKTLFDRVLQEGGIWHLYGHSWMIQELNLWDDLKETLDYVCKREGVIYVSNADVLKVLRQTRPSFAAGKDHQDDDRFPSQQVPTTRR